MEIAMVALVMSMGLSFIGMTVAIVFDKSRLVDFFCLVCMALGAVALVLAFIRMLLN
ncbi:hypothetical protein BK735P2_00027 [Bacteroides phage BK735P2]|nr:hypothetical protein BK735P2_00027 [Bacteroides phage BK735P2]